MEFLIKNTQPATISTDCLVIPVFENSKLSDTGKALDEAAKGQLHNIIKQGDIAGKPGDTLVMPQLGEVKAKRILLFGAGEQNKKLSTDDLIKSLSAVFAALNQLNLKQAVLALADIHLADREKTWVVRTAAQLAITSQYEFNQLKSTKPKTTKNKFKKLIFLAPTSTHKALEQSTQEAAAIAKGINVARDLGNLPGNICTPSYLAKQAKQLDKDETKLKATVLGEKEMEELGMGSFLSVGKGSKEPAKLIVMEYNGGNKGDKPHVLVGKGITFDSGGISLKPGQGMDEMKFDMCGAASVFGAISSVIALKLPINVVAIVAAAENLPSGNASKPGDIVTSMSGQTIEILNTDAEGRLVLCDALTYAEKFEPESVIDIATLTGACVVALGSHASGMYSNNEKLAKALQKASDESYDRIWPMPLWDAYQKQLDSNFADMANIGGPEAGSVTAACFLARFTKKYHWAHLDIAGSAWLRGDKKGATGRPVSLLVQYLINQTK
ncbi:leucyl aminopeptidase [Spartinivicinus poritis]|uniref:Probable cytosol aminopeptidase n=1 Tax=Spartinivicinus poritis TaxID=2994640 RepID=A0ABT5U573_9GAMM|nr:leucyl aminopeptidase [Spartinivicinus sp. A2-2]MDE1460633.1 leucyl aminopeptidase [Spartinivicinus sp. A2-2]